MLSREEVYKQLEDLNISVGRWGHTELNELPDILTENENISHIVNGYYENGFAMLVSTDHRMLLIDKKPFNFLNVDDFRFDMINQLDYKHRLFKSIISISAGPKDLRFVSYDQKGLRKLLDCVQRRMIDIKEEKRGAAEKQHNKLDQLDQTLKSYIQAQLSRNDSADLSSQALQTFDKPRMAKPVFADAELSSQAALENYLKRTDESSNRYLKTGSLLPSRSTISIYLHPASVVFAKLPLLTSGRHRP